MILGGIVMKGNTGVKKHTYSGANSIKVLSTLLILGALCGGCASKQSDEALLETQNNVVEIDHRVAAIEGRVQNLDQEVQASQGKVYDVYYKSGKKTGMTARPTAQAQPAVTGQVPAGHVPVAYASPITNTPMPAATPAPHAVSPKPVPKATSASAAVQPTSALQPHVPKPRAPLGALDPNTKMSLKDDATAQASAAPASQELSLPPETAMYVPTAANQAPAMPPATAGTVQPAAAMPPATPVVATAPQAPVHVAPMAPATPAPTPKPAPRLSPEKAAYKHALDLVRGGQATAGRAQFEAFLQAYPQSSLAANAYYWIGESYYSQANYTNALYAFKQVTTHYPRHHKTSDALLKAGLTYQKLGDSANAQMQYRALLADFPNSNAAKIVRNRNL